MLRSIISATPVALLNTDNGICDAARVSFAKLAAMFPEDKNFGMMRYMHANKHWSPYGHSREIFRFGITRDEWVDFVDNAVLAGFTWKREGTDQYAVNGSLWAWYENAHHFPVEIGRAVKWHLRNKYRLAGQILFPNSHEAMESARVVPVEQCTLPQTLEYANLIFSSFRVKAPIFTARQMVKHQIHLCWNEESRRYIDDEPEIFLPEVWRQRAPSVKQGSRDEAAVLWPGAQEEIEAYIDQGLALYERLLAKSRTEEHQVAPELARSVLTLATMTNWVWTGSLAAWHRVISLREDSHAQREAAMVAVPMDQHLNKAFPSVWAALHLKGQA